MNIQHILVRLATLGPIGLVRGGGTFASACTLPLIALLAFLKVSFFNYILCVVSVLVLALFAARAALPVYQGLRDEDTKDPGEIVIDEVLGCLITFSGITISWSSILWGFLIFRLLDINKPFGIKRLEYFYGPWGILFDDMAAGLYANLILIIIGY
ncbi:MAG: phosphatidylglycerophosphatase A [Candidatus Babeliales bacterium]